MSGSFSLAVNPVPDTIRAVKEGKANAGVVYYSAAVAALNELDIIRFPASVNLSDTSRNAASVPGTAKNGKDAMDFVRFPLCGSSEHLKRNWPAARGSGDPEGGRSRRTQIMTPSLPILRMQNRGSKIAIFHLQSSSFNLPVGDSPADGARRKGRRPRLLP